MMLFGDIGTLAGRDLLRRLCGLPAGAHTVILVKSESGAEGGELIYEWISVGAG